jgi:hypothetical protein
MDEDELRAGAFGRLLAFLKRLDQAGAWYRLGHMGTDSVMVEVALPGWRWEVEFMADGPVEIERYQSVGGVADQPQLLKRSSPTSETVRSPRAA